MTERADQMAEAAEVDRAKNLERGADLGNALALLLFLALVTCHSSLLFAQQFSRVQAAMLHVTSAWAGSPFTPTLASNPAQGDLVLVAYAAFGGTNSGPSPITTKAASSNNSAVVSAPARSFEGMSSGLCFGGPVDANLWLGYLLDGPANASTTITFSWAGGPAGEYCLKRALMNDKQTLKPALPITCGHCRKCCPEAWYTFISFGNNKCTVRWCYGTFQLEWSNLAF
jgi:hypothetical protein